jgi:hypothetical protein
VGDQGHYCRSLTALGTVAFLRPAVARSAGSG